MNFKGKKLLVVIAGCLMLAGCGEKGTAGSSPGTNASPTVAVPTMGTSPITLSIFMDTAAPDQFVQDSMIKPVQAKFPNVTLNFVKKGTGTQAADLIAANNFPDLIYSSPPFLPALGDLGLLYDMNDLIKKNKFDTSLYDKTTLDQIKLFGDKGELYALPFYINYTALYYHKDVFDKFGVAYPKDGMTWDEVIDLGKKLTRNEGGIEYQGLGLAGNQELASQLSLPWVDPKTNKAQLNNDGYKKVVDLIMKYTTSGAWNKNWKSDNTTKYTTLAMNASWADRTQDYIALAKSGKPVNWDMVTFPVFSGSTGNAVRVDSHDLLVSSLSKNKDAAFQVLAYMLSKDFQTKLTREGYLTGMADKSLEKDFAADVPELKGKNLQAIFKVKPAPSFHMTKYDSMTAGAFGKYVNNVKNGDMDRKIKRTAIFRKRFRVSNFRNKPCPR